MNYHVYHPVDVVNGPGTRATLFVSGCEHRCPGCYNAATWDLNSGHRFTPDLQERIVADLNDTRLRRRGLSLSGGDPLHPANLEGVGALCEAVRARCPGKDIWLWTGYLSEHFSAAQASVAQHVDVLIDGPFLLDLKDVRLRYRGSSNQRVLRQVEGQWQSIID